MTLQNNKQIYKTLGTLFCDSSPCNFARLIGGEGGGGKDHFNKKIVLIRWCYAYAFRKHLNITVMSGI